MGPRLGELFVDDVLPIPVKLALANDVPPQSPLVVSMKVCSRTEDMEPEKVWELNELRNEFTPDGKLRPCSVIKTFKVCEPAPDCTFSELVES